MLEVMSARARLSSGAGVALHARGLVAHDLTDLRRAAEALRLSPRRENLARACEDAGTLAVALGQADGPALLREALAIYEDLGARRGVGRIERSLRAAGMKRGSTRPQRKARSGWDSLTEAERRVVRLVPEGLSNGQIAERLFLSRRTVESHLGRAYSKLGASTRVQLAAIAADV